MAKPWIFHLQCAFLLFLAVLQQSDAIVRVHKGPTHGETEVVLQGRTLTDADDGISSTQPPSPPSRVVARSITARQRRSPATTRRIVDFALHLKRDVLFWTEIKQKDGGLLHQCSMNSNARHTSIVLSGHDLEPSDFRQGVVLVLDSEDYERCLRDQFPSMSGIDPSDRQVFVSIRSAGNARGGRLRVFGDIVAGRNVIPEVDFDVHDRPEPEAEAAMHGDTEFADEPHSPWSVHFAMQQHTERLLGNASLSLPTISRRSFTKTKDIGKNAKLSVSASFGVGVGRFKFRRSLRIKMDWEQHFSASVRASLDVKDALHKKKRTGELSTFYIPALSFSVKIPGLGGVKAGGFVGLNWVSELHAVAAAKISFSAQYRRKERVNAQLLPPRYRATHLQSTKKGSGNVNLGASTGSGVAVHGFFGVRPVIGMRLDVTYKTLKWEKIRIRKLTLKNIFKKIWKVVTKLVPRWKTKKYMIEGNIGSDLGVELSAQIRSSAFRPYTGSGLKIGTCDTCHSAQGYMNLKGKNFGLQYVKNGRVTKESTFISVLFQIRLGTICAIKQTCSAHGRPLSSQLQVTQPAALPSAPQSNTPSPTPTATKAGTPRLVVSPHKRPRKPISNPCRAHPVHRFSRRFRGPLRRARLDNCL